MGMGAIPFGLESSQKQEVPLPGGEGVLNVRQAPDLLWGRVRDEDVAQPYDFTLSSDTIKSNGVARLMAGAQACRLGDAV